MKKTSISLIIGLMGFALLGVMSMQLYFLKQSYNTQSDLFDRSVNDALNNVVSKLAKQDANNFLNHKAQQMDRQKEPGSVILATNADNKLPRPFVAQRPKKQMKARERRLNALRDSLRQVIQSNKLDEEF